MADERSLPQDVAAKIELFVRAVRKHFAFLKELSYEGPQIVHTEDSLLKFWTKALYYS